MKWLILNVYKIFKFLLKLLKYYSLYFYHWYYAKKLRNTKIIKVVFYASNLSMWRYQHLYDRLKSNERFDVYIVLSSFSIFSVEEQSASLDDLRIYFKRRGCLFIDYDPYNPGSAFDVRKKINPDILFYPQPYSDLLNPRHVYTNFKNKLLCYYPYAFWDGLDSMAVNLDFHNLAWKLYYSTSVNVGEARKKSIMRGKNVVLVGYPNADDFLNGRHIDIWKPQNHIKKRIIYAPHFTIIKERCLVAQSTFLSLGPVMLSLAEKYKDTVQFVFKPHPRLKNELYLHKDWGKEKTDAYYKKWEKMENTQVECGDYIDLFMTSDAMIHDCGSFSIEYLYTQNPVMFLTDDKISHEKDLNELGVQALESHYIGKSKPQIENFIEDVVINGNDSMKESRAVFFNKYLLPPNGKSVIENTVEDLFSSLHIKSEHE